MNPAEDDRMWKRRRHILSGIGASVVLAGCIEAENGDDGADDSDTGYDQDVDVILSYEVVDGANWDEDFPSPRSDVRKWAVLSFEVLEGEISMEDLWFHSRLDTGERYKTPHVDTNEVLKNGIDSRGEIIEGGTAEILYEVPTYADLYEWNLSGLERQTVGGENIEVSEPGREFYNPVTVSLHIEITHDSDLVPSDADDYKGDDEDWAVVKIDVLDGVLNMEDVWFRSRLQAGDRNVQIHHEANTGAERGIRSRGEIQAGHPGHAIYAIPQGSTDPSWITEEMRQDVTISETTLEEDDGSNDEDDESDETSGPTIHDFSFSSASFEPGEILEIDVEVADEMGIDRVYFRFEHEDGGGAVFDAYRDFDPPVEDGTYTIDYQWPDDTPGGTYEATWIFARDSIGNTTNWTDEFPISDRQVEIDSDKDDTEGPTIHDFSLSSSEFAPGEVMEIDAEVTDDTGIERLYFRFEHVDGGGAVFDAYRDFQPPVGDGTYTIEYQWPSETPSGTYEATWIFARDPIGNIATWTDAFPISERQVEIE